MAKRDGRAGAARGLAPVVTLEGGRKALRVGGVIQSVAVDERYMPDVWDALLPLRQPESALILGLGGGSIAQLMTRRWGALPIVGVERDPAVVWLARREFGLDELPHLSVVVADAFAWAPSCDQRYDAICVDLYTAGKMAHGVLGAGFLRDLRRLLTPRGEVAFNLWRSAYLADQLRRIEREFCVIALDEADDNLIAHAVARHG
ncbi:MAG TPA: methyltransferase domain-containing protein [Ktedonobacterales bacterium]|nr:methyltransferase domain-containing protein [Ktedonobacterales bacterium]